ncbi:MAG: hypothetical protein WCH43_01990 [Verrucomicrobiota bacterium]
MKLTLCCAFGCLIMLLGAGCVSQKPEIHGDMGVGVQSQRTSWVPNSRPNP